VAGSGPQRGQPTGETEQCLLVGGRLPGGVAEPEGSAPARRSATARGADSGSGRRTGPDWIGSNRQQCEAEPGPGSVRFGSVRFGSVRFGSDRGSARIGSPSGANRTGSDRGGARFGSDRTEPDRIGVVRFGGPVEPRFGSNRTEPCRQWGG